jgi:hypothetical protein
VKRSWLVVALLLSLGVNLGLAGVLVVRSRALARWAAERPGFEPGARLAERLDLDPAERREFMAAQRRLFERARAERDAIQRLREEVRAELLSEAPDPDHLDRLLEQVSTHERQLTRAFVESVLESRRTLPPEALDRYLRFLDRFGPGRPGPGEPGAGPPPDPHDRRGRRPQRP